MFEHQQNLSKMSELPPGSCGEDGGTADPAAQQPQGVAPSSLTRQNQQQALRQVPVASGSLGFKIIWLHWMGANNGAIPGTECLTMFEVLHVCNVVLTESNQVPTLTLGGTRRLMGSF